jgi:hypothetical protein
MLSQEDLPQLHILPLRRNSIRKRSSHSGQGRVHTTDTSVLDLVEDKKYFLHKIYEVELNQ